jgi:hypothetical protein
LEALKPQIPPWMAVNAHGCLEAQNGALEGLEQWAQIPITVMRSRIRIQIPIKVKSWISIRIEVKSWIRIYIKVMRFSNPASCGS